MESVTGGSNTSANRDGVILRLVDQMRRSGSWGGETHIQKSAFFLQHLLGVDLGYRFVLHLHGPYSFTLRDNLTRLRARRKLDVEPNPGYGASLSIDKTVEVAKLPGAELASKIQFVSERISVSTVKRLERVATAYYLQHVVENPISDERLPDELRDLKPHISEQEASLALEEVSELLESAQEALAADD